MANKCRPHKDPKDGEPPKSTRILRSEQKIPLSVQPAFYLPCPSFHLGKLMNVKEDYGELSSIARQGSGIACRSIYGGFVKWCMGKKDDGSDSIAV